jgi:hypothetical protein
MSEHAASEDSESECGKYKSAVLKSGVDGKILKDKKNHIDHRLASSDPGSKA